jgi:hypothetical protein
MRSDTAAITRDASNLASLHGVLAVGINSKIGLPWNVDW